MDPSPGSRDVVARARTIVRFTRQATRSHNRATSSYRDLAMDLYSNLLAAACVVAMAVSVVGALGRPDLTGDVSSLVPAGRQIVTVEVLWCALVLCALVGLGGLARRLGPVAVGRAESAWWLPLPVDRGPMVGAPFLRRVGLVAGVGSVAGALIGALTPGVESPGALVLVALTVGLAAAGVVMGAAASQISGAVAGFRAASRLMITGAFLAVASTVILPQPWPLLLAAVGVTWSGAVVLPRLGAVRGAELIRGGAVSGHAHASVFFLDVNELRRALSSDVGPVVSARGTRFYLRSVRGPVAALLRADVVAFLRLRPPIVPAALWLLAVVVVLLAPAVPVSLQLLVLVVAGCVVSASVGGVARRTAILPEVDLLLPLPTSLVRCSRLAMPCLTMVLWTGVLTTVLAGLGAVGPPLILLGVLAGAGMGSGSVRAATRPPTDWTRPPVETPFGSVPRDQISSLTRGTDVTVAATVPLLVALFTGEVGVVLVIAQVIVTGVAVALAVAADATPR